MSKKGIIILVVIILLSFPLASCNVFNNDTETSIKAKPDETKQDISEESNSTNEEDNNKESFVTKENKTNKFIKFPEVKLYTGNGSEYIDVTKNYQEIFYPIYDRYYNLIYYTDFKCTLEENSFVVEFEFEDILDKSAIISSIDLHGYEDTVIKIDEDNKSFRILFKNVSVDEEIPITIKNSLKSYLDVSNDQYKQLKEALNFTIVTVETTKAKYKVYGIEKTVDFPTGAPYDEDTDVVYTHLTNEPKQIEIAFSNSVNRNSVEVVLDEEFSQGEIDYSLKWVDDKMLLIDIKDFNDRSFFNFELNNALDERGHQIENNFCFEVDSPNELWCWNVEEDSSYKVKTFHDIPYHVKYNPTINNYMLLVSNDTENGFNNYIYNIKDNKMTLLRENLGVPYYLSMGLASSNICWINDSAIAYYNSDHASIFTYSIKDDKIQSFIDLRDYLENDSVIKLAVSPNGKKFAVATSVRAKNVYELPFEKVYVFTIEGKKIFESQRLMFSQFGLMGSFFGDASLSWLNNEEIIYESGNFEDDTTYEDYYWNDEMNVLVTNVKDKKTTVLSKGSTLISTDILSGSAFVNKHDEDNKYDYWLLNNDDSIQLSVSPYKSYNFRMLNNDTIVYDRRKSIDDYNWITEIVVYNLIDGEEKVIGKGDIIGISPDSKKVYFMTNQKYLIYYN